jgi:hypothetical protein
MGCGEKRIDADKFLIFARDTVKLRKSALCSKPSKAILPLARPAAIPRARVEETERKAISYHSEISPARLDENTENKKHFLSKPSPALTREENLYKNHKIDQESALFQSSREL